MCIVDGIPSNLLDIHFCIVHNSLSPALDHPLLYTSTILSNLLNNLSLLRRRSALDPLGRRTVQVVIRDPALIIRLLGHRTSCNSRPISTNNRNLILGRNSLLGSLGRALSTLTTLSSALGLREESLDPGLVNEVERAEESGEEGEVQEDTDCIS